jgi:hypothetical protein
MKSKEILNIPWSCNDLKNLKKLKLKFENYEICQYLMISYVKAVVKF